MTESDVTSNENILIESIKAIIIESRKNLVRTVNTEMLSAYWNVGRLIVENEQNNRDRAGYGEETLNKV